MKNKRQKLGILKSLLFSFLIIISTMLSACGSDGNSSSISDTSSIAESSSISQESSNVDEEKFTATPAMWEVNSKDGKTKLYLFGSIHAADNTAYPLRDDVMNAFDSSEYLAVEADIVAFEKDLKAAISTAVLLTYTDGTKIYDHISKDTYDKIKAVLQNEGKYMPAYDSMKPMAWQTQLDSISIEKTGLNYKKGLDTYFLNKAKKDGKKILEVESVQFQMNMINSFSDEVNELILKGYTEGLEESVKALSELYSARNNCV